MNTLKRFCVYGIVFVLIVGTLSHFIYDWSGQNNIVALFCPVNESTWEHMKLLFFPACLYISYLSFHMKDKFSTIISAASIAIYIGTFSIPLLFYSYTKLLGFHHLLLDILTFMLSVILCFVCLYIIEQYFYFSVPLFALTSLLILALCFFIFTFYAPNFIWFLDPTKAPF